MFSHSKMYKNIVLGITIINIFNKFQVYKGNVKPEMWNEQWAEAQK